MKTIIEKLTSYLMRRVYCDRQLCHQCPAYQPPEADDEHELLQGDAPIFLTRQAD